MLMLMKSFSSICEFEIINKHFQLSKAVIIDWRKHEGICNYSYTGAYYAFAELVQLVLIRIDSQEFVVHTMKSSKITSLVYCLICLNSKIVTDMAIAKQMNNVTVVNAGEPIIRWQVTVSVCWAYFGWQFLWKPNEFCANFATYVNVTFATETLNHMTTYANVRSALLETTFDLLFSFF